jgi:predicted permease
MTPIEPGRSLRWVAERLVRASDREFLLGDLDDEYSRRRASGQRASSWYLVQALHAGITRRRRDPAPALTRPRDLRRPPMFDAIWSDVTASARGLRKQPAAILTIVVSLALGIGAATAMFTVVRAVLLAPLPYGHSDRVVEIFSKWTGYEKTWISDQEILDYQHQLRSTSAVAAWDTGRVTLTGAGDAVRVGEADVTANLFDVFGVKPFMGRTFTEEEARAATPKQPTLIVISYGLWQRQFGGRQDVLGTKLDVNGVPAVVLGVMPKNFQLPTDFGDDAAEPTSLWIPLWFDPAHTERGSHGFYAAGRLAAGATVTQLNEELKALTTDWTRQGLYPVPMKFTAFATSIDDEILGGVRPALLTLLAAVGFLLLVACANAAALLLARAETRQREFATRTALGASRWRLIRQQLVEGLLLSIAGAALGLGLALSAKRALDAIGPTAIPRAADVSLDWRSALFMTGIAIVAAVVCSLPPAFRSFRLGLVDGLKDGGAQTSAGGHRLRMRNGLVVAQLAFAMMLLVGTGLTLRALWSLQKVDLGFTPGGVLTARVAVPAQPYDTPKKVNQFFTDLLTRVRAIHGVQSAGLMRALPIGTTIGDWGMHLEGTPTTGDSMVPGDWQVASDGALEALGETLVRGRLFASTDTVDTMPVALVNEVLAAKYWPNQDAIGKRFQMGGNPKSPWITVVGIVGNVRHNGITAPIKTKFYRPYTQFSQTTGNAISGGTLVVRTSGGPLALAGAVNSATHEVDPNVPLAAVRTMDDVVETSMTAPRLTSSVFLGFGLVAVVLAAVGIYGLLVFLVSQRMHEIGIRVAIGAGRSQIVQLVFGHGVRLAALGIVIGLIAAAIWTRTLSTLLYGVPALDPLTFVVVPMILLVVAMAACLIPARRAASVDPIVALKRT